MKVLKKGKDRNIGRELTCSNCAALLLVLPKDVKSYTSTDYGGETDTTYYVTCPDCQKKTYVSYKYQYLASNDCSL